MLILTILGCKQEKKQLKPCKRFCDLPLSTIQAFFNDNNKQVKLRRYDTQFLCENLHFNKKVIIEGVNISKYSIPAECGNCLDYNILAFNKDESLACPINIEYYLLDFSNRIKDDSICYKIYNKQLNLALKHQVDLLNTYITFRSTVKDSVIAIKLAKQILTQFIFDKSLSEAIDELNIDPVEYGLDKYTKQSSSFVYFWINGVVFKYDSNKSSIREPINLEVINPDSYITT